jgi:large subunit ribosomal protein L9
MKVFLQKDVSGVGEAFEVVDVADGYARNYLLPRGLAVRATKGQIKAARDYAASAAHRESLARERSEVLAEKLAAQTISFQVKAGETGRLYGSITAADIAEKVEQAVGVEIDKRWLELERPIRDVGEHTLDMKLEGGVVGHVKVTVEPEED